MTFLLRNTGVFDADEAIQPYVRSGKARLVKGDALSIEDVARGWAEAQAASESRLVDYVVFTVGQYPFSASNNATNQDTHATTITGGALHHFSLISGAHIMPADICTAALLNVIRTIPNNQRSPATQPKILACSSTGITKASHQRLPLPIKIFYGWLIVPPHVDKFCMERLMAYCAGIPFADPNYRADLLPQGWQKLEGMPEEGTLKKMVILRPAWLTDGPAKADEQDLKGAPYRIHKGDGAKVGWTISRQDVGHFIAENALQKWDEWEGERVSLFY